MRLGGGKPYSNHGTCMSHSQGEDPGKGSAVLDQDVLGKPVWDLVLG